MPQAVIDGVVTGAVNLVLFGLVVLVRRLVHHEGLSAFGLRNDRRGWGLLLAGLAGGTCAFSIYPAAAVVIGAGRLSVTGPAVADTLLLLASWGFGFAGVALLEEGLFRGYLLPRLRVRFSTAVAVVGQAGLFGAFHLFAYAGSRFWWLGLLNVAGFAIVVAVLVLRTRSLMAAVGFHVAWDLVQTMLRARDVAAVDAVLNLQVTEGIWTGTPSVPETGFIVSVILAMAGVALTATRVFSRSSV